MGFADVGALRWRNESDRALRSVDQEPLGADDVDDAAALGDYAVPFPALEQAAGREGADIGERGQLFVLDPDLDAQPIASAGPDPKTRERAGQALFGSGGDEPLVPLRRTRPRSGARCTTRSPTAADARPSTLASPDATRRRPLRARAIRRSLCSPRAGSGSCRGRRRRRARESPSRSGGRCEPSGRTSPARGAAGTVARPAPRS